VTGTRRHTDRPFPIHHSQRKALYHEEDQPFLQTSTMADEQTTAPKKEKPPAPEKKPFAEFIQEDYLPALEAGLEKQGITDLKLNFTQAQIAVQGMEKEPSCWQVIGTWKNGQHQFNVYFFKEDIKGQRAFSYSQNGAKPSTLEPFLIDERKITLGLLVFGVITRLNGQKWLTLN